MKKNRKDKIIQAAVEIFSEKGFSYSTISNIANKVGIGEATIYEYFVGKMDILLAIPEQGMRDYLSSLERHLNGIKGADNKLRKVLWHLFDFYQNSKQYMTILIRELRSNPRFYESNAYYMMKEYNHIVLNIIKDGQKEGVFNKNIDIKILLSMIMGGLDHLILPMIMMDRQYNLQIKYEAFEKIVFNILMPTNSSSGL